MTGRPWVLSFALAVAAAAQTGDPLAQVKRVQGKTATAASGALETVMLLAQLATPGPPRNEFQARVKAKYGLHASHPAVQETASLLEHGWSLAELARFVMLMNSAPYFMLNDSAELDDLAGLLPGTRDRTFHQDRLHGYAKLIREFYWDNHVGRFLRTMLPAYQQAVRDPLAEEAPPEAKVTVSLLAPVERLEFTRSSAPAAHLVVLGSSDRLPSAEPERGSPPSRSSRKSRTGSRPRPAPSGGSQKSKS